MQNEVIAYFLGEFCYEPKKDDDDIGYAIQLFIEKVVLPKSVEFYSAETMEEYILNYLNKPNS